MNYILSTLVFGVVVWWFALGPGRKAGDHLTPLTRKLFGAVAGGAGILLALKGRWDFAIVLVSLSAWLLGFRLPGLIDPIGRARRSEIRTASMLVEIDLADGTIAVRILAGRFQGRQFEKLKTAELVVFAQELATLDPPGLNLVAQELDRRAPGWRKHVKFDTDPRQGAAPVSSEMREEEAYHILGLEPGASEEAVRAAHRTLIARFHPDRGGSTYLAAMVNRAKDVALAATRRG
ncbi:MAG: molecular chaperone DnaJ [Proteobacteria bacterium]|nr:molecular chaperone DnaJ [Pseudomonadota bacterium]